MSKVSWREALQLETEIAILTVEQKDYGVYFNEGKARYYISLLSKYIDEQYVIVRPFLTYTIDILESKVKGEYNYVRKIKLKNGEYTSSVVSYYDDPNIVGGPFSRISIEEPSMGKRGMIIDQLLKLGWKPNVFTEKGFPKLTVEGQPVDTLEKVGDFGKALSLWYIYNHRRSQIKGFLGHIRPDGRIEADLNSCATNTRRAAHRVVANIPRPTSIFGKEMRELFGVRPGRVLVGADASGLELRMLAHHMGDPEYIQQILEGDIHLYNLSKTGSYIYDGNVDMNDIDNEKVRLSIYRNTVKTWIYGFLYGSGDAKSGAIIGKGAKEGKLLKESFFKSLPLLSKLVNKVRGFAEARGYLPSIDGGKIWIRKFEGRVLVHTALNALLQTNGSIVVKRWLLITNKKVKERGLDAHQIIFYHDEKIYDCSEEVADEVMSIMKESLTEAGEYYNLRIKLDAEAHKGYSWGEIH